MKIDTLNLQLGRQTSSVFTFSEFSVEYRHPHYMGNLCLLNLLTLTYEYLQSYR